MPQHQHGGDIYTSPYRYDFSANLNPLGMPRAVADAACAGVRASENYPDVQCRRLVGAIAAREHVKPEQVICGNGAAEVIFMLAAAQRPKTALLAAPGFAEYEQALLAQGCRIAYYPLQRQQGFLLREDYLGYLEKEKPEIIFLCNPNNPTGLCIERPLLLKILDRCREMGILAAVDLCFLDFLEDREAADLAPLLDEYPNLFILKAFTKTYAMAGLRLGYGLSADTALLSVMKETVQPWNVSIPAQEAGAAALKETAYVEKARALVKTERAWLLGQLKALGFTVYPARANFIFFEGPPGLTQKCRELGILIRDCSNYHGLSEGYYRIAVRTHEENEELIRVLGKLAEKPERL